MGCSRSVGFRVNQQKIRPLDRRFRLFETSATAPICRLTMAEPTIIRGRLKCSTPPRSGASRTRNNWIFRLASDSTAAHPIISSASDIRFASTACLEDRLEIHRDVVALAKVLAVGRRGRTGCPRSFRGRRGRAPPVQCESATGDGVCRLRDRDAGDRLCARHGCGPGAWRCRRLCRLRAAGLHWTRDDPEVFSARLRSTLRCDQRNGSVADFLIDQP